MEIFKTQLIETFRFSTEKIITTLIVFYALIALILVMTITNAVQSFTSFINTTVPKSKVVKVSKKKKRRIDSNESEQLL